MFYNNKLIISLLFFSLMSIGWGQDTTPPELIDFNMSPNFIDYNYPWDTEVLFTGQVFDEYSVCDIVVRTGSDYDLGWSFGLTTEDSYNYYLNYLENFENNDNYFDESGTYPIKVTITDCNNNSRVYTSQELETLGFTHELIVDFPICDNNDGDLNYDGTLNVIDIVVLVNCILSIQRCDTCFDINYDGSIDVIDVIRLINIILDI